MFVDAAGGGRLGREKSRRTTDNMMEKLGRFLGDFGVVDGSPAESEFLEKARRSSIQQQPITSHTPLRLLDHSKTFY